MAKVTDVAVAALQAYFETGDKPLATEYAAVMTAIQEAAQDHEHTPDGGSGSGTGDAGAVGYLTHGADASKTATPVPGQVYSADDTSKFYVCFTASVWTQTYP